MTKKKKIVAVFGNVALFGQERANIQVFSVLQEAGHDLLLAVNDFGFQWHLQPEIEARALPYVKMRFSWNLRKTFVFKHLKGYFINIPKSNRQLYKLLKMEQPDVIHVCNDNQVMSLLPTLLSTKTKLIYRLGDKPTAYVSKFHALLWKRYIIPRVDHFVCISNFVASELMKLGCEEEKITVIYNYPPKRENIEDPNVPVKNQDLVTFTFIGQLTKDKGVDLLVKAFIVFSKECPNAQLLMAGDLAHNKEMTSFLKNLAHHSGLGDKIQFLGKITNVDQLLKNSDINIIPSVCEEALSNVIVEAKTNGIASIVFPSGGLAELVKHKENGYIASEKSVADLSNAMRYYYLNRLEIKKQGEAAFKSLKEHGIDYDSFKEQWLQVYE